MRRRKRDSRLPPIRRGETIPRLGLSDRPSRDGARSGSSRRPSWLRSSSSISPPGRAGSSGTTTGTSPAPNSAPGTDCTGSGSTWGPRSNTTLCLHSAFWVEHRAVGRRHARLSPGQHLPARHGRPCWWPWSSAAWRSPGRIWRRPSSPCIRCSVESVAWITELKNTLSGVFYLGAMLLYLRFDQDAEDALVSGRTGAVRARPAEQDRHRHAAGGAAGDLLVAAGTVIVETRRPAAGPVLPRRWNGLPCDRLGRTRANRGRRQRVRHRPDRTLSARRAGHLVLSGQALLAVRSDFIYPRWHVSRNAWWQYLFPAAAIAAVGRVMVAARRWRGPLAALLFFVGTLFPVLGFFNVYSFRYSLVADHFQYLASLGVIALFRQASHCCCAREGLGQDDGADGLPAALGRAGPAELAAMPHVC